MLKKMHFLFDAVPPYVEFKRGERFDPGKNFPERGDVTPDELTDTQGDDEGNEWMSYGHCNYE